MHAHYITLEIDYKGRGCLEFELPADATEDEIAYFRTLVPRVEHGLLEMVDPETCEVVFSFRPKVVN
jgi:hypothetical protein